MVPLHDAIRERQTQSGAFAHGFGGEEGVKNLVADLLRYSGSVVFHLNPDAVQALAACTDGDAAVPLPLEEPLSERELEILSLICTGASNKEVAAKLFITEGTVKNHVTNILGKLGVRDRTQAVVKARELRLV